MIKENGIDFIMPTMVVSDVCGVGNLVGWGKTAKHIAYVCATNGFKDTS